MFKPFYLDTNIYCNRINDEDELKYALKMIKGYSLDSIKEVTNVTTSTPFFTAYTYHYKEENLGKSLSEFLAENNL